MGKIKHINKFSIENFKKLCDFAETCGIICENCEHYSDKKDCENTHMFCEKTDFCSYFSSKEGS